MIESPKSPSKMLAELISKYDPTVAGQAKRTLVKLRKMIPGAIEMVYDYRNSLVIGFGATEKGYEAAIALAVYTDHILLYFNWGKKLKDPTKILRGSAKQVRFIPLLDTSMLDDPAVRDLIKQAIANSAEPFGVKRKIVIKSNSTKKKGK